MLKKFFATMLLAVTLAFIGAQNNTAEANWQVVGIRGCIHKRLSRV